MSQLQPRSRHSSSESLQKRRENIETLDGDRDSKKHKGTKRKREDTKFDSTKVKFPIHYPNSSNTREGLAEHGIVLHDQRSHFYTTCHNDFEKVLGRRVLHGFKYTYSKKMMGTQEWKVFDVLWDYEMGYVRICPMFKSSDYDVLRAKGAPKKYLTLNDLMSDSASLTGGKIECQGFWIPYEAAKELCSKFCYDFRHALTPLFGNNFVEKCPKPSRPFRGTTGTLVLESDDDLRINVNKAPISQNAHLDAIPSHPQEEQRQPYNPTRSHQVEQRNTLEYTKEASEISPCHRYHEDDCCTERFSWQEHPSYIFRYRSSSGTPISDSSLNMNFRTSVSEEPLACLEPKENYGAVIEQPSHHAQFHLPLPVFQNLERSLVNEPRWVPNNFNPSFHISHERIGSNTPEPQISEINEESSKHQLARPAEAPPTDEWPVLPDLHPDEYDAAQTLAGLREHLPPISEVLRVRSFSKNISPIY